MESSTLVPLGFAGCTTSVPPRAWARSAMPRIPRDFETALLLGSIPLPSSLTVSRISFSFAWNLTRTFAASAWRAMLVSVSWKMRKMPVATSCGTTGSLLLVSILQRMPPAELAQLPLDCGEQSEVVQDGGPQVGADFLDALEGGIQRLEYFLELRLVAHLLDGPAQVEFDRGEGGAEFVVDLPCDARPFHFPCMLQPERKFAQCAVGLLEFLLVLLAQADVRKGNQDGEGVAPAGKDFRIDPDPGRVAPGPGKPHDDVPAGFSRAERDRIRQLFFREGGAVLLDEIESDAGKFIAENFCAGQVQNGPRPGVAVDDCAVQIQKDDSVGQGFDHDPVFAVAVGRPCRIANFLGPCFHAFPFGIELINYMTVDDQNEKGFQIRGCR